MNPHADQLADEFGTDPESRLPMVRVRAGQYFVTAHSMVMLTTLGSCVCACLRDTVNRVYGINHFMLPDATRDEGPAGPNARFGAHAMELLINAMLKAGAERPFLSAQVFGGASVLRTSTDIGLLNSAFAVDYLQREAIPVTLVDVGGHQPQRLYWRVPLHEPRSERMPNILTGAEHDRLTPPITAGRSPVSATLFDIRAEEVTA